jgi:hypothetical protein
MRSEAAFKIKPQTARCERMHRGCFDMIWCGRRQERASGPGTPQEAATRGRLRPYPGTTFPKSCHLALHVLTSISHSLSHLLLQLQLQPLCHGVQHAAVQPREPAGQPSHSSEYALPVRVARALALRRVHLAQHVVKRSAALTDFLNKTSAFTGGQRDVKAAAAAAADVQLETRGCPAAS